MIQDAFQNSRQQPAPEPEPSLVFVGDEARIEVFLEGGETAQCVTRIAVTLSCHSVYLDNYATPNRFVFTRTVTQTDPDSTIRAALEEIVSLVSDGMEIDRKLRSLADLEKYVASKPESSPFTISRDKLNPTEVPKPVRRMSLRIKSQAIVGSIADHLAGNFIDTIYLEKDEERCSFRCVPSHDSDASSSMELTFTGGSNNSSDDVGPYQLPYSAFRLVLELAERNFYQGGTRRVADYLVRNIALTTQATPSNVEGFAIEAPRFEDGILLRQTDHAVAMTVNLAAATAVVNAPLRPGVTFELTFPASAYDELDGYVSELRVGARTDSRLPEERENAPNREARDLFLASLYVEGFSTRIRNYNVSALPSYLVQILANLRRSHQSQCEVNAGIPDHVAERMGISPEDQFRECLVDGTYCATVELKSSDPWNPWVVVIKTKSENKLELLTLDRYGRMATVDLSYARIGQEPVFRQPDRYLARLLQEFVLDSAYLLEDCLREGATVTRDGRKVSNIDSLSLGNRIAHAVYDIYRGVNREISIVPDLPRGRIKDHDFGSFECRTELSLGSRFVTIFLQQVGGDLTLCIYDSQRTNLVLSGCTVHALPNEPIEAFVELGERLKQITDTEDLSAALPSIIRSAFELDASPTYGNIGRFDPNGILRRVWGFFGAISDFVHRLS